MGFTYQASQFEGLRVSATISNIFNAGQTTKQYEKGDKGRDSLEQNENFLVDTHFQTPRAMSVRIKYDF